MSEQQPIELVEAEITPISEEHIAVDLALEQDGDKAPRPEDVEKRYVNVVGLLEQVVKVLPLNVWTGDIHQALEGIPRDIRKKLPYILKKAEKDYYDELDKQSESDQPTEEEILKVA